MTFAVARIIAATVIVGMATIAGVATDTITGEALVGVYAMALGYIFGVGDAAATVMAHKR